MFAERAAAAGLGISFIVTLTAEAARRHGLEHGRADAVALASRLGAGIVEVERYADPDFGEAASRCRIAVCFGWQRLVPPVALSQFEHGIIGTHGSFKPLPHGRGRSPLKWALLLGRSTFFNHLFRYVAEADAGPVYDQHTFPLSPFDDHFSASMKLATSSALMAVRTIPRILAGEAEPLPRAPVHRSWFPRRTTDDGEVNWYWGTVDVLNHIRSWPATFGITESGMRVRFDRAQPWELPAAGEPGQVVDLFDASSAVVKTGDSAVLLRECSPGLRVGDRFRPAASANAQGDVPW